MTFRPPVRRDLRRRPGPQGQPGLRVRRPLAARRLRRRRRRRPRRHRLEHRDPAAPPARRTDSPTDDLLGQVAGALHRAHDRIGELVDEDPALNGTSTTATVAALRRRPARRWATSATAAPTSSATARSRQLTKDHTFVQTLIDEGRITEDEARVHPHRNLILKAIDGIHEAEPDLFLVELEAGDRLLLCSDGACGVLDDGRLADILSTGSPDYAAVELVRASLEAGSTDNVTCIVADVRRRPTTPTAEPASRCWSAPPPTLAPQARRRMARPLPRPPLRRHRRARAGRRRDPRRRAARDRRPTRSTRRRPATPRGRRAASLWLKRLLARRVVVGLVWIGARRGLVLEPAPVLRRRAATAWSTIFRGLNADLPGLDLSEPYETTDVELDRLSDFDAGKVARGHRGRQPRRRPAAPSRTSPSARARRRRPTRAAADMAQTSRRLMGFVHRRRRGAELFLLVLALAVGIGAYAAVGLGVEGEVPADILGYGGWLAALVIARAHRGPPRRAVRRPGAAARRRRAQRARPGGDPPARPGLRGRRTDRTTSPSSS